MIQKFISQTITNLSKQRISCFSTKTIAEYIWIDGSGLGTRSKAKTIDHKVNSLADLPNWNYDGSSTYQALTHNSEVIIIAWFTSGSKEFWMYRRLILDKTFIL